MWVVSYWKVLELIFVYCQMWFQLKYRSELLSKKLILALNLNLTKSDKKNCVRLKKLHKEWIWFHCERIMKIDFDFSLINLIFFIKKVNKDVWMLSGKIDYA